VHDVGYLEAGLMCSPEPIVFTEEMISMMRGAAPEPPAAEKMQEIRRVLARG
jgi:hypothetical protein